MRIRGGMLRHTAAAAADAGDEAGRRARAEASDSQCGAAGPTDRGGAAAVEARTPGGEAENFIADYSMNIAKEQPLAFKQEKDYLMNKAKEQLPTFKQEEEKEENSIADYSMNIAKEQPLIFKQEEDYSINKAKEQLSSFKQEEEEEEELGCLSDAEFASVWALVVEEVARRKSEQGPRSGPPGEKQGLTFELVSRCFSMPIKQAAQELNVGLTVLKKRCRELGIPRWPHRKVKSLQTLIDKVQELAKSAAQQDDDLTRGWVERLQRTKKLIEERPEVTLDEETRELRQACFKEDFKRRRLLGHGTCW